MVGATLRGSNLQRSRCDALDFTDTDLSGADFSDAQLEGANLSGAKLEGADLRRACLHGATLSWSGLQTAQFTADSLVGSHLVYEGPPPLAALDCASPCTLDAELAAALVRLSAESA